MKKLILRSFLSALMFLNIGCKKDNDDDPTGNSGITGQDVEFQGTAQMTIEYWEYDVQSGQDVFIQEKSYAYPVYIYAREPLNLDGVEETNPFNLQIYPDRLEKGDEEGHLDFSSCLVVDDMMVGKVILQYWNFALNGDQISGNLTDTHLAESAAANIVWCWDEVAGIEMTMPFYMDEGTTIQGTINATSANLTISGQSTDTYRKFYCEISADVK